MIRPNARSIPNRDPTWHVKVALTAAVAGLVLLASPPLGAQTAAPVGAAVSAGTTAAREGNIYDHKDHQPTAADVGATLPSPASTVKVEQEIQHLLRQAAVLDRQSEEQDQGRR